MKHVKIVIQLFLSWCIFTNTASKKAIEINIIQGNSKPIPFTIIAAQNFLELINFLKRNLAISQRFIHTQDKEKAERIIQIKEEQNGTITIEVIDNQQKKTLKKFLIKKLDTTSQLKTCDEIYEILTHEKGIFRDKLVFTVYTNKNTYELYSLDSNLTNLKKICDEKIKHLSGVFLCDNKIFLSKFTKKDKAFSILFFDIESKSFYNVFTIKEASICSPVVYDREIYVAVTEDETTGIYKRPFTGSTTYSSFKHFISDPRVVSVINVKGKIATAPTISNGKIAFCADFNGRPGIYLYPNQKISSDEGSYFDPNINENNLAAIKVMKGQFHLVLINLKNGIEKTLLTKYFIGQPTWSPCGNWIAVSCRNHGEKDFVFLIHKSGKYVMKVQTNHKIKNIIWLKGK